MPVAKQKKRNKLLWAAMILVAALAALLIAASNYLVTFSIARKGDVQSNVAPASTVSADDQAAVDRNYALLEEQKDQWLATVSAEDASILSDDGLRLVADVYRTAEPSHRWAIVIHGYTSQKEHVLTTAAAFGLRGYNILTPDMRAHGESEGDYIGMGWLDRRDVIGWIDWVLEQDPEAEIVLQGVSMGGATVMMTAGEADLPAAVKGVVEDCGYTSVWDIFSDELRYLFYLPDFPILYTTELFAQLRAGYGFHEASALEQVKKCRVPILFIHGGEDNFVHTEMVYELYDACASPKDILVIEGAGHGQASSLDPERYFDTVFDFLARECGLD